MTVSDPCGNRLIFVEQGLQCPLRRLFPLRRAAYVRHNYLAPFCPYAQPARFCFAGRLARGGEQVRLEVHDNGVGIRDPTL